MNIIIIGVNGLDNFVSSLVRYRFLNFVVNCYTHLHYTCIVSVVTLTLDLLYVIHVLRIVVYPYFWLVCSYLWVVPDVS